MNSPAYAQPFWKSVQIACIFPSEAAGGSAGRPPFIPCHRERQKKESISPLPVPEQKNSIPAAREEDFAFSSATDKCVNKDISCAGTKK